MTVFRALSEGICGFLLVDLAFPSPGLRIPFPAAGS
jgi:hypothetical protein